MFASVLRAAFFASRGRCLCCGAPLGDSSSSGCSEEQGAAAAVRGEALLNSRATSTCLEDSRTFDGDSTETHNSTPAPQLPVYSVSVIPLTMQGSSSSASQQQQQEEQQATPHCLLRGDALAALRCHRCGFGAAEAVACSFLWRVCPFLSSCRLSL